MHAPRQLMILALLAPSAAHADDIPIVTLSDVGPNQEIPTHRSFYVAGDAAPTVENAQAIVVRRGSPGMFGDSGPDCRTLLADLRIDAASSSSANDDDDDADAAEPILPPRYEAGIHRAFELFPRAQDESRDAPVLVSAAWQRTDDDAREFKVLIPHDGEFFSAGYGFCMFVVTTERTQEIDDATLGELVDGVARKIVECGDKSSCDDDALADFEVRATKELAASRSIAAGPAGEAKAIAARLKEAARAELGTAAGIVEARDHLDDRWHDNTDIMQPATRVVWAEVTTDPFAQAVATMLARSAALLPQVRPGKGGTAVALYTTDGRLQVRALQLLDDGRSIRVASSTAPTGDQARVVTATTDTLDVTDSLTLYDLIELGHGRVHVDKDWVTLTALGDRMATLGLAAWTADDAAYLAAATSQLRHLSNFVDDVTSGIACGKHPFDANEVEQTSDAVRHHLGEWLVCQDVDAKALAALSGQLDELLQVDHSWKATKDQLVARSKRIVTLTTTAPVSMRVSFESRTWPFSFVTPIVGYAAVLPPDETFGLFYLGVQIHLDPNAVDDVLWHDGVTTKDLRRAIALEVGLAPYGGSFGPQNRYSGPGGLPPVFLGLAVHIIPYTSLTFGGAIVDRKRSTLAEEQAHTVVAPYLGLTLQLNLPDLIRQASHPTTDTTATR